jgi:large subunit ribosomal protein L35
MTAALCGGQRCFVLASSDSRERICEEGYKQEMSSMPKLKTNRAAAKRFRVTAKGFKRYSSRRRHNLGDKPRKQKRQLRSGGSTLVHETDVYRIIQLMPHAGITPKKIRQRYLSKAERAKLAAIAAGEKTEAK